MSVQLGYRFAAIPEWVLYHEKLTDADVRVFGILARYGNDVRPALGTIAERMGKSKDTIRRCVHHLVAVGAVQVEERFEGEVQLPNRYRLAGDEPFATPPGIRARGGTGTDARTPLAQVPPEREQDNESNDNEKRTTSARRRNPIFDALAEACGYAYDEMTQRQRRACAVAAAELAKVDATPEEILWRAQVYRQKHTEAACTPNALANQWAGLRVMPVPSSKPGLVERARAKREAQRQTVIETEAR